MEKPDGYLDDATTSWNYFTLGIVREKGYLKSSLTEPAVVELASHLGRKDRLDLEEV